RWRPAKGVKSGRTVCAEMTQTHPFATLSPLAVGAVAFACTILIHAIGVIRTVDFLRREKRLGRAGVRFGVDVGITAATISFALVAHLIAVAVWAAVFVMCGEFPEFGSAYYHSAVNYTSLGYGDVVMSPSWRLLGPLEAANGALMFG